MINVKHYARPTELCKFLVVGLFCGGWLHAQEPVFSGPQTGEAIAPFEVRSLSAADAGKQIDYVANADGKPLLLVFVHDLNRQSIAMVRNLTTYSAKRKKDGLQTAVVLLSDDANDAEKNFQRIKHAFNTETPTGVSLEGLEGPGRFGLNRLVMLTIVLSKENKVVANYALVQPSLQVDLPKIAKSIVELIGGPVPTLEELVGKDTMRMVQGETKGTPQPDVSGLVRPLIQKNATDAQVDQLAEKIEQAMKDDQAVRREIYRVATAVTGGGKLSNYGTTKAQEYLIKWAKEKKKMDDLPPKKERASKE